MGHDISSLSSIQKLISLWEESGLSKIAFCKSKKVSYHWFNYWQRKLSKAPASSGSFLPVQIIEKVKEVDNKIIVRGASGILVEFPMHEQSVMIIRQLLG
jgi:hypothetical protein